MAEVERLGERGLDVAERLLGGFEMALGLGDLGREPSLLLSEQIDRNGATVLGVKELLAFGAELGQPAALSRRLLLGLLTHACTLVLEGGETGYGPREGGSCRQPRVEVRAGARPDERLP